VEHPGAIAPLFNKKYQEAEMRISTCLPMLALLLSACGPAVESGGIATCRPTLDAMAALTGGLEFPSNFQAENPVKTGSEFDVMQYFSVLDHLSMQPGSVLDYVYHYDGMGGYPLLYVHPVTQPPFATEADLLASGDRNSFLDYVQVDDTPEGFFQFVLLSKMTSQFYLFWHAGYNDSQVVCDQAGVTEILSTLNGDFGYRISLASRARASLLTDIEPSVIFGETNVEVQLLTFTRWGGFYQETFSLSRSMPHTILGTQEKNLVPYDCGVMF
jgi:hypothetical protein